MQSRPRKACAFEVTAESRLAVAPLVRTGVAPGERSGHDDDPLPDRGGRTAAVRRPPRRRTTTCRNRPAGCRRECPNRRRHRAPPGVEFAVNGSTISAKSVAITAPSNSSRRSVSSRLSNDERSYWSKAETADRDVVTHGLGLGADDPGVEVGPVLPGRNGA